MAKDYYRLLGLSREASAEEIKTAFRRLARQTHPDSNPGDTSAEARFREVAEAYEVLSDPDRRRRYDRGDTIDLSDLLGGFTGFDDLLRSVFGESGLFGTGSVRQTQTRGRDILARVEIDLAEAVFGTDAEVSFRTNVGCGRCGGDGAEPGSPRLPCPTCRGAGAVRVARRGLLGTVMSVVACETCAGRGETISDLCSGCGGMGVNPTNRKVRVEVPAGVGTGSRLRLSREGEASGRGGTAGDLYVDVVVREDPRFERHGDDLVYRASVGIAEASLGAEIDVPLAEGESERVSVPAGTQPGWTHRLLGRGMGRLGRRGRGDLLVHLTVEVPTELSTEEEDLLRRYAELRKEQPAARRRRSRR